nr:ankyrin repeat protein [Megavirus caiporensis]
MARIGYSVVSRKLLDEIFQNNDVESLINLFKSNLYDYDMSNIINYCSKYDSDLCIIIFDELKNMDPNLIYHALDVSMRTLNDKLFECVHNYDLDHDQCSKLFADMCNGRSIKPLQSLLNRGADINYNHGIAFIGACKSGCADICRFVLDHGLIINYDNPNIIFGIKLLIRERNLDLIKLLLEYGFDFSFFSDTKNMSTNKYNKNDEEIINILMEQNIKIVDIIKLMSN